MPVHACTRACLTFAARESEAMRHAVSRSKYCGTHLLHLALFLGASVTRCSKCVCCRVLSSVFARQRLLSASLRPELNLHMAGGMSRGLILRCLGRRSRFRRAPTSAYCSRANRTTGPARLLRRLSVSACLSTSETRALKEAVDSAPCSACLSTYATRALKVAAGCPQASQVSPEDRHACGSAAASVRI